MPEIHAICAASALHGTIMNREHHAITLAKRHNDRSRLHTGPLLRHHEFATGKVFVGFRQQNGELEREHMFAVEVLVQAVVIVGPILEQKRCRPDLAGAMATLNEIGVFLRVAKINTHRAVPAIGDRDKMRVDSCPKACNKIGQRIAEILVLATPETMPRHHDAAAKEVVLRVQCGQCPTFARRKKVDTKVCARKLRKSNVGRPRATLSHGRSPRMISSTIALFMHPSATSSAPRRCISTKRFLPLSSINVTAHNKTLTERSELVALRQQPSNS